MCMNVLMISGDVQTIKNISGPFSLTLRELSKEWSEIDVLCPGLPGLQRNFSRNVHLFGVRKFLLALDLYKFLKRKKYDLIVTHDYGLMLNGLSAFIVLRFFNIPQVSEIHHIEGFPQATTWKERLYAIWGRIYVRVIARTFKGIRVDNQGDIFSLLKRSGIPNSKILYLPPIYLELEKYQPRNCEKKMDILFVGRLADNKGLFTILKAVKLLRDSGILLKTVLKGRGPLESRIQEFIDSNQMQNFITIDKRILDEDQLIELYNESKILVCASTVEGGPRVTLEAMACGTPVVTTACGLMPEVIEDGQNGYLFDGSPEDLALKLKSLFTNQDLLQKTVLNSRASVKKYDFAITLKNYALAYKSLLQP